MDKAKLLESLNKRLKDKLTPKVRQSIRQKIYNLKNDVTVTK